jgi:hypothetical protein
MVSKAALAITLLLLTLVSLAPLSTQAEVVSSQFVDRQGVGGNIFFDSQNNPHIFYVKETIGDINQQPQGIYYAIKNGEKWDTQKIDYAAGNIFIMDTNNKPHIINLSDGTLRDYPLSSGWNINGYGLSTIADDTMALDSNGNFYQVYFDSSYVNGTTTSTVSLAVWTKTGVTRTVIEQKIGTSPYGFSQGEIAVGSNGQPHIIYVEDNGYLAKDSDGYNYWVERANIKYANPVGIGWTSEVIATNVADINGLGKLVLDSKGQPHFCFYQENRTYSSGGSYGANDLLVHTFFDGSKWSNQTISSYFHSPPYSKPFLRLDSSDNPNVYYFTETYRPEIIQLFYASLAGNSWGTQAIWSFSPNSYGYIGISNVAFDSYGNPYFTYQEVMGTYRSAYRYGNLTYVAFGNPLTDSPLFVPAIVGAIVLAVIAISIIGYRLKKKRRTPLSNSGQ